MRPHINHSVYMYCILYVPFVSHIGDLPMDAIFSKSYCSPSVSPPIYHGYPIYITSVRNKARKVIGLFYRQFYQHLESVHMFCSNCTWPHLKLSMLLTYAWDLFHKTEVDALENVQKSVLKVCLKTWDLGYDQLLLNARIPSLKIRHSKMNL